MVQVVMARMRTVVSRAREASRGPAGRKRLSVDAAGSCDLGGLMPRLPVAVRELPRSLGALADLRPFQGPPA